MAADTSVAELQEHVTYRAKAPTRGADSKDQDEISLLDVLIVLAERKRLIFGITAGFAIVAIVVSLLLPTRYTATVTLLPPQQNSSLSSQMAAQLGAVGGMAALTLAGSGGSLLKNPNDMYVAMFKSRTVEDAMIQRFGLMQEYHKRYLSDTRKKFERFANVDGNGKDGLIHISVEAGSASRAAELATGYVDEFRNLSQHLAITEAGQRRLFFEQQLKDANKSLADAEEALKETEQKTGLIAVDAQAKALVESAATLRGQIAAQEVKIRGIQTFATGENAQVVEAEEQLTSLREQLAKLSGSGDDSDAIIVPKGQMTSAGMDYVRHLRDVKYNETIFEILARQFEVAKLDEAKEGAIVQVVDPAMPPDKRSFPKRTYIILGGVLVGLFAGICTSFAFAHIEHLKSEEEISAKFSDLRRALSTRTRSAPPQTKL